MAAVIGGLHVAGFGILILVVASHRYALGASGTFAIGTGVTAYTLGLRHAFDADHIAAIDNTTRKLMGEGKRPLSVGFFFSLGHSTIVFALTFLIALGVRALSSPVRNSGSLLHNTTNVVGTTVSGTFLYAIAILNIIILVSIVRIFFQMRQGAYNEEQLERELNSRGLMNRVFGKRVDRIRSPWQMYPVGVLFGLGFDTASEVALLVIAGSARRGRTALLRDHLPADPLCRRNVAVGHHRRVVHELRLRLGLLQTGAQGVLQHHDHRAIGRRGPVHRHDRARRSDHGEARDHRVRRGLV